MNFNFSLRVLGDLRGKAKMLIITTKNTKGTKICLTDFNSSFLVLRELRGKT